MPSGDITSANQDFLKYLAGFCKSFRKRYRVSEIPIGLVALASAAKKAAAIKFFFSARIRVAAASAKYRGSDIGDVNKKLDGNAKKAIKTVVDTFEYPNLLISFVNKIRNINVSKFAMNIAVIG